MTRKNINIIGILALLLPCLLRGQQVHDVPVEKTTEIYTHTLTGTVFYDQNKNNAFDNEPRLRGWFVKSENALTGETQWTSTDETGHYQFKLEVGTYNITVITPNRYWLPSQQNTYIFSQSPDNEIILNFPVKATTISPAMQVDLVSPTFRSCTENTYTLRYANNGTAAANNSYINLTLDALLEFAGASLPLAGQHGRTFRFNIGDVPINGFGSFSIKVRTMCEDFSLSEQNLCSEAHIFPDTLSNNTATNPSIASSVVNLGRVNSVGYSKHPIIIEDVIIFIMPIGGETNNGNEIDSSDIIKRNADTPYGDSIVGGVDNRLSLHTLQTSFFSSKPQYVQTPSVFHICTAVNRRTDVINQSQKLGKNTSIEDFHKTNIYPNPMTDMATIEIKNHTDSKNQLLIFDSVGRLLRQEYFIGDKLLFYRKDLSTGVYFYKIMNQNTPLSIGTILIKGQ